MKPASIMVIAVALLGATGSAAQRPPARDRVNFDVPPSWMAGNERRERPHRECRVPNGLSKPVCLTNYGWQKIDARRNKSSRS